ncbi:ketopantoate reductase family protein [Oceanobacillus sp. J11TS1]|uniref:ketopantoate reductase family protein n=1 Tax=Oceanobacillus sp. J11TS1 TaxID=2807191 RepID=UPI001B0F975B|nr:ketopantoate reductase C-terminal domain-containing protein [Oceanobacillus sp. J11TS1]GIO24864.1 hypothetical protein J11TS1_34450 [Oceanobacillus sp. J11TS1]
MDISSLEIHEEADIPKRIDTLRKAMEPSKLLKASMLQDLEKGRITEIDFIKCFPAYAKGHRISTPYNDIVVQLVKKAEKTGELPNFDTNITYFEELNKQ